MKKEIAGCRRCWQEQVKVMRLTKRNLFGGIDTMVTMCQPALGGKLYGKTNGIFGKAPTHKY
jgi:hypothetical protein